MGITVKRAELKKFIKKLGGAKVVARACGISSSAISHWKQAPLAHLAILETLAQAKKLAHSDGVPITCSVIRPDLADCFELIRDLPTPEAGPESTVLDLS